MAWSDDHESRIKRLRYRAWRRGTLEMDLMLGRFADGRLAGMDDGQLARFERLLDEPDPDIQAWIDGRSEVPEHARTDVFEMMLDFQKNV